MGRVEFRVVCPFRLELILAALLLRRRERRRRLFQDLPISRLKVRATLHFLETLQQTLTGPSGSSSFSGISWIVAFLNVMIGKGSLDSKEDFFCGEAETTALLPSSGLPSPPVPSNNLIGSNYFLMRAPWQMTRLSYTTVFPQHVLPRLQLITRAPELQRSRSQFYSSPPAKELRGKSACV